MTLAKFYARKRVIEAAKAAGIRYRELSAADITRRACDYLDGPHSPELVAIVRRLRRSQSGQSGIGC
jgi:hypothetical protein